MKSIKKSSILSMGLLLATFAYGSTFTFENKLSTNTVNIKCQDSATVTTDLKDKASATFESDKVELHAEVEYTIDQDDNGYLKGTLSDYDYSIVFIPVDFLSLGWHSKFETAGAYLPIYDDTLESGYLGSSGFTVIAMPVEGLRISASLPLDENANYFYNPDQANINVAFGTDYSFNDLVTVGVALRNVFNADSLSIGAYVNVTPFEDFFISAGYTYAGSALGFDDLNIAEDTGVSGKNLINAAISKSFDDFSLTAEGLFNLVNADNEYDIYAALTAEYSFNENWAVNATVKMLFDVTDDGSKPVIGGQLNGTYTFNDNHSLEAGVKFESVDSTLFFAVPITYKFLLKE